MNITDAIRLSTIIQGVQAKRPVVWMQGDGDIFYRGELRRIYRAGEMPGEDFARDIDDVLDLFIEVEHKDFTRSSIQVREAIRLSLADMFFVE